MEIPTGSVAFLLTPITQMRICPTSPPCGTLKNHCAILGVWAETAGEEAALESRFSTTKLGTIKVKLNPL